MHGDDRPRADVQHLGGQFDAPCVAAHNDIHEMLQLMNTSALRMGTSPKLQNHEVTNESIVTALDIMKDATLASKVMLGADIASRFKHDPRGASKAKEFLAANKTKDMLSIVRNGLWGELTQMAQMASDNMTLVDPVVAFIARSPLAKSEVASSKKIKPESTTSKAGSGSATDMAESPAAHMKKRPEPSSPASGFKRARRS